jgi:hypothetical protein
MAVGRIRFSVDDRHHHSEGGEGQSEIFRAHQLIQDYQRYGGDYDDGDSNGQSPAKGHNRVSANLV